MKKTLLGVVGAAILTAVTITGCSSSGGGPSSFTFDPGRGEPTPPVQQTVNFTLPALAAGDQAVLLMDPVSGDHLDQANNLYQMNSVLGRAPEESQPPQAQAFPDTDPCYSAANREAQIAALKLALETNGMSNEDVPRQRFDELAQGTQVEVFQPAGVLVGDNIVTGAGPKITVQKMLSNATTVHCNILAEVVGGTPVIDVATAQRIADVFDTSNPFDVLQPGTIGIYDRMTGLSATPWETNPVGGRDGDVRVNLMVVDPSSFTTDPSLGLVIIPDMLPATTAPGANNGEFIYLNAEAFPSSTNDLANMWGYHVTARCLGYLIFNNTKVSKNGTFPDFNPRDPFNSIVDLLEKPAIYNGLADELCRECGFSTARALNNTATGGAPAFTLQELQDGLAAVGQNFWNLDGTPSVGQGLMLGLHLKQRFGEGAVGQVVAHPALAFSALSQVTGSSGETIFQDFHRRIYLDSLNGLPLGAGYNDFTIGGAFFTRAQGQTTGPNESIMNNITFLETLAPGQDKSYVLAPWSFNPVQFTGGDGSPFNLQLNMPITARASFIHESPAGTFSSQQVSNQPFPHL